jgi:hypothetical protein
MRFTTWEVGVIMGSTMLVTLLFANIIATDWVYEAGR